MADRVTWFELPADDTDRASKFYKAVFDWGISDMGNGSLAVQSVPSDKYLTPLNEKGVINGDISPRSEAFDKPLIVIQTEDIEARLAATVAEGGAVALAPQKLEAMGMIWAIITDTEGNNIGVIQMI